MQFATCSGLPQDDAASLLPYLKCCVQSAPLLRLAIAVVNPLNYRNNEHFREHAQKYIVTCTLCQHCTGYRLQDFI